MTVLNLATLTTDELTTFAKKIKKSPVGVNEDTFQPYKDIDGERYYIEAETEMLKASKMPAQDRTKNLKVRISKLYSYEIARRMTEYQANN